MRGTENEQKKETEGGESVADTERQTWLKRAKISHLLSASVSHGAAATDR